MGGGGRVSSQRRNMTDRRPQPVIKATSTVTSHEDTMYARYDVMRTVLHPSGLLPPNLSPQSTHEKTSRQIPTEEHSTEHRQCLKTAQVIKNKDSLSNCHGPGEPKET